MSTKDCAGAPQRLGVTALPLLLCLVSSLAAAQGSPPVPRINRNPVFREGLPPAPQLPASPRVTMPPATGPCDPRDSTTRPVQPAASIDDRSQVVVESPAPGTPPARPSGTAAADCN